MYDLRIDEVDIRSYVVINFSPFELIVGGLEQREIRGGVRWIWLDR